MTRPRIAYFVHDLGDPAVSRRIEQFSEGGADVTLLGFCRSATPPATVAGVPAISLGRTRDAKFIDRILAVGGALLRTSKWRRIVRGADAVVARNLECLAVASAARGKLPLTYEILDVHRLLVDEGRKGQLLRSIESKLIRNCSLIFTSSPAFVREHLARYRDLPEVLLVENKVVDTINRPAPPSPPAREGAEPWRIGWFGNLRCRRSLIFLAELAKAMDGRLEIDLRGAIDLPIRDLIDDVLSSTPHIRYHGRYAYADLAAIYGAVHFAWAIDFFEEGLNSSWLLPNRLYEGCANGAVPIALNDVETGDWLNRHGIGLTRASLPDFADALGAMTPAQYKELAAVLKKLPRTLFVADGAEATNLVAKVVMPAR